MPIKQLNTMTEQMENCARSLGSRWTSAEEYFLACSLVQSFKSSLTCTLAPNQCVLTPSLPPPLPTSTLPMHSGNVPRKNILDLLPTVVEKKSLH